MKKCFRDTKQVDNFSRNNYYLFHSNIYDRIKKTQKIAQISSTNETCNYYNVEETTKFYTTVKRVYLTYQ